MKARNNILLAAILCASTGTRVMVAAVPKAAPKLVAMNLTINTDFSALMRNQQPSVKIIKTGGVATNRYLYDSTIPDKGPITLHLNLPVEISVRYPTVDYLLVIDKYLLPADIKECQGMDQIPVRAYIKYLGVAEKRECVSLSGSSNGVTLFLRHNAHYNPHYMSGVRFNFELSSGASGTLE
jgi:hypothetical protein